MTDLKAFLDAKPLYYDEIDYSRFPKAYAKIKDFLKIPKAVHIVGTNGKGSTGRFLALLLKANGRKVAHFTSPHIFSFNERFWMDGKIASDEMLQSAHERILEFFKKADAYEIVDKLSYFEWATLLACELFRDFEEVIFEAGLGGEYDATNVLDKKLSIFTPVGIDHTALLGESLEEIATTKLRAMSQNAIISPFFAKLDLAQSIAKEKGAKLEIAENSTHSKASRVYLKNKSDFLRQNFALALGALKMLGFSWNSRILGVIKPFDLRGRMEKIAPNLVIDVGHNEHAAKAICASLSAKKVNLIYNCFADKDAAAVLKALKPCLKRVLLYEYESKERKLANIENIAKSLGIKCAKFDKVEFLRNLNKNSYLVFGSFMLVSEFLKEFHEFKTK